MGRLRGQQIFHGSSPTRRASPGSPASSSALWPSARPDCAASRSILSLNALVVVVRGLGADIAAEGQHVARARRFRPASRRGRSQARRRRLAQSLPAIGAPAVHGGGDYATRPSSSNTGSRACPCGPSLRASMNSNLAAPVAAVAARLSLYQEPQAGRNLRVEESCGGSAYNHPLRSASTIARRISPRCFWLDGHAAVWPAPRQPDRAGPGGAGCAAASRSWHCPPVACRAPSADHPTTARRPSR